MAKRVPICYRGVYIAVPNLVSIVFVLTFQTYEFLVEGDAAPI